MTRSTAELGSVLRARRRVKGLTLADLARECGGSPNERSLSRVEHGSTPSVDTAINLATALEFPRDLLLNAAGHATEEQTTKAIGKLAALVHSPAKVLVYLSVYEAKMGRYRGKRGRMMDPREEAFIVDLEGPEPYVGECIVAVARQPEAGQGVVVADRLSRRLSAMAWGGEAPAGTDLRGVIIRVTSRT